MGKCINQCPFLPSFLQPKKLTGCYHISVTAAKNSRNLCLHHYFDNGLSFQLNFLLLSSMLAVNVGSWCRSVHSDVRYELHRKMWTVEAKRSDWRKKNQNWVTFNCSKRNLRSVDEGVELLVEMKTCRLLPLMAHGWPALVNIKSVATHRKRGRSVSLGDSRLPSPTVCRPTLAVDK